MGAGQLATAGLSVLVAQLDAAAAAAILAAALETSLLQAEDTPGRTAAAWADRCSGWARRSAESMPWRVLRHLACSLASRLTTACITWLVTGLNAISCRTAVLTR